MPKKYDPDADDDATYPDPKVGEFVVYQSNDLPRNPRIPLLGDDRDTPTKIARIIEVHDRRTLTLQPFTSKGPSRFTDVEDFGPAIPRVPRFSRREGQKRHGTWQFVV